MRRQVIAAAAVGALALLLVGCLDPCDNTLVREVPSPDTKYLVAIYERGCGAPSAQVTHLHLRKRGEKLTFDPEESFCTIDNAEKVDVTWRGNSSVDVRYRAKENANTWPLRDEGIAISYHRVRDVAQSHPPTH